MIELDEIYNEYAEFIFKFLMTLCKDADTAEELTQETFYRAVKSSDKYNGKCKVSTWLCQIAKHTWYQEIEKRKRKKTCSLDENIVSSALSPVDTLCLKEEKMQLMKTVYTLSEDTKEVVLLRITGAFSFREIGEIFGKNENWARVTYYRGKQKIMKGKS